eukprot:GHVU01172987.1.p1 GENE.GHVU01172987.1~~GHVU01172987.1.p1  ORF type:complete len:145 (-),score=5.48 GHVU01172987.1:1284-1718(-)
MSPAAASRAGIGPRTFNPGPQIFGRRFPAINYIPTIAVSSITPSSQFISLAQPRTLSNSHASAADAAFIATAAAIECLSLTPSPCWGIMPPLLNCRPPLLNCGEAKGCDCCYCPKFMGCCCAAPPPWRMGEPIALRSAPEVDDE